MIGGILSRIEDYKIPFIRLDRELPAVRSQLNAPGVGLFDLAF
jgi:hypothetical protein